MRAGGAEVAPEVRQEIISNLIDNHGFLELDINALIRDENERRTEIGREVLAIVSAGKII